MQVINQLRHILFNLLLLVVFNPDVAVPRLGSVSLYNQELVFRPLLNK